MSFGDGLCYPRGEANVVAAHKPDKTREVTGKGKGRLSVSGAKRSKGTGAVSARKRSSSARKPPEPLQDVAVVVGRTEDMRGYQIVRKRADEPMQVGEIRPMEEGKPIEGEILGLRPRKDFPFIYDVNVHFDPSAHSDEQLKMSGRGRPALVATNEYRKGWEAIWGDDPELPGDKQNLN